MYVCQCQFFFYFLWEWKCLLKPASELQRILQISQTKWCCREGGDLILMFVQFAWGSHVMSDMGSVSASFLTHPARQIIPSVVLIIIHQRPTNIWFFLCLTRLSIEILHSAKCILSSLSEFFQCPPGLGIWAPYIKIRFVKSYLSAKGK